MVRILEFKEFKKLLFEADETDPIAPASEPPAGPPPPPPSPEAAAPDFGMPAPEAPQAEAPAAEPTPADEMKFIFIEDAKTKKWHGTHSPDGGVKRFTQYAVTADELIKWLEVHKFDADKDVVLASLVGKRDMPDEVYSTFKREVEDNSLGADKGTIDIKFNSDTKFDNPSTSDLNVVFLKSA